MDFATLAAALAINGKRMGDIVAPLYSTSKTYSLGDICIYKGALYECTVPIPLGEAWTASHWKQMTISDFLDEPAHYDARITALETRVSAIEDETGLLKFGVSGFGNSNATLTRIWDSIGRNATPGTDTVAASSDFDNCIPFNRKKCVGEWKLVNNKAVFHVNAYYGDPDYAEDGSMGDYVAVECPAAYYYEDTANGILGVSGHHWDGWKAFDFMVDRDTGLPRPYTYIPCYALALKDGKAVSLPGYQNEIVSYKTARDKAKLYGDGSLAAHTMIEPSSVDWYEYVLMTVEFATQNMQSKMAGATSMRYAADAITAVPGANKVVVTSAIGATYVLGQSFVIDASYSVSPSSPAVYNCIIGKDKCNADGSLNASGSYWLLTYDGVDRSSNITAGVTQIGSRPWITGATQGYAHGVQAVKGHTGSPVSNTNGIYPNLYRWRENPYGNQNMTALDLFDKRVGTSDSDYYLEWYYLPDPTKYYPAGTSNPNATDLANAANGFVKVGETPHSSYKDGYIKERGFDPRFPEVKFPILTTGGSASTYTSDYAYLVHSSEVRSVRRRGSVSSGSYAGPCFVIAHHLVSYAYWYFGAALFMLQ